MSEEAERFDLLTRLAAYSGCSLRFGIVGFVDGAPVLSTVTHLHHIPSDKTLLEVADHIHEVMLQSVTNRYEIPPNIKWQKVVSPGMCLN